MNKQKKVMHILGVGVGKKTETENRTQKTRDRGRSTRSIDSWFFVRSQLCEDRFSLLSFGLYPVLLDLPELISCSWALVSSSSLSSLYASGPNSISPIHSRGQTNKLQSCRLQHSKPTIPSLSFACRWNLQAARSSSQCVPRPPYPAVKASSIYVLFSSMLPACSLDLSSVRQRRRLQHTQVEFDSSFDELKIIADLSL